MRWLWAGVAVAIAGALIAGAVLLPLRLSAGLIVAVVAWSIWWTRDHDRRAGFDAADQQRADQAGDELPRARGSGALSWQRRGHD